ncbi:phage virion morphogenesis protein [uncultured Microbulbifer sp.]|uniref:phage virion morphogenesis protein n=1 Tax=uncultured Microbulbifer sp. TaxID=348147 RepID=UPI002619450D|nr:phage virion morphogenesis protein [uncultured Microbulbifer sp.]
MSVRIDIAGQVGVKKMLKVLQLPPAKRKRLLAQVGRKVRVFSRKRLRQQRGIDGQPWEARKSGNRKMLRGISKRMQVKTDPEKTVIGFKDGMTAGIAYQHQHGVTEHWTADKAEQVYGQPDYDAPATRKQAKALREEGYKVRRGSGRGWRRPSLKWVTENMTVGQAGIILRSMRDAEPSASWKIPLPARTFLGVNLTEIRELATTLIDETLERFQRA